MAEPAFDLVDKVENKELTPVDQRALSFADNAKMVPAIQTSGEYVRAGDLWKEGKSIMAEIDEGYDSLILAAHKLHKDAIAKKAKYYAPVETAVKTIKRLMSDYDAEQERIRLAEQRRLEEISRKEEEARRKIELARLETERKAEEERLLALAISAEQSGDIEKAEELQSIAETVIEELKQETAQVASEPVYVAPVVIPKSVPKMQGGPVYRTIWKFRIKDVNLIPRQYMIPDEKTIGGVVRSSQGRIMIPGIEPYEERV